MKIKKLNTINMPKKPYLWVFQRNSNSSIKWELKKFIKNQGS